LLTISNEAAIVIENAKNFLELKKLREKEKENYFQTILALARTVDEKDAYTRGHLDEVTRYGVIVAEELAESLKITIDMEELKTALLLHDIGKIGIPDALLHKTSGLTPEEFEIMKQHAEIGARIIEPIEKLKKIGKIIKHHQEKYNGTGYPDGLKGEDIPLESRIVAVVDAYHAMISDRPYRKALPEEMALNELKNCRGAQFDPLVVDAFLKAYEKGKIVKRKI
jgi:putative nucleotidyltransferase with HDIG domain